MTATHEHRIHPDPVHRALASVVAGRAPKPLERAADLDRLADVLEASGLAGTAFADARCRALRGEPTGLPRSLMDRLRPTHHRVGLHTTLVLESADRALAVLASAGIPALLFKGVALLRSGYYPDPGGRLVEDADILVPPDRAPQAVHALTAGGFEPWVPWEDSRMVWLSSFSFSDRRAPDGVSLSLDLHWAAPYARLRQSGPWGDDPLWQGAAPPYPAPEAHFALVAEHFLKHLRLTAHLRGLADLARMLPALNDGPELARQVRLRGSLPGLRRVMAFLRDGVGVSVDAGVARALGAPWPRRTRESRRLSWTRLLQPSTAGGGRLAGVLGEWTRIGSRTSTAAELARVAVPSRAWLRARYPDHRSSFGRRWRYVRELSRWARGQGASPLSPNQEFEV